MRLPSRQADDPRIEGNKAVVRRLIEEVWGEGKLEVLPEIVTQDAIDHAVPPGGLQGIEGARHHIVTTRAGVSDCRLDIVEMVAEGDLISCELLWSGYHDGDLFDIPSTYRWARCRQSCTYRLEDGKIAEVWQVVDMLGMLEDFGLAPPRGTGPLGILGFTAANFFKIGLRKARKPPPKPPPPPGWPFVPPGAK